MRDELDKWTELWAQAQEKGLFPAQEKGHFSEKKGDPEEAYWNRMYQGGPGAAPDPLGGILTEDVPVQPKEMVKVSKPDGKTPAEVTDDLGGLPQGVKASTRGKDQMPKVTPDWAGGEKLAELHRMKESLHQLEVKLNTATALAQDEKVQGVQKKIDALKQDIDDLSDSLTPDFVTDYLS